ncbi:MAG: hypothetical protein IJX36_04595, partial [Thermoguttaceae bacterium]|nr:hypothetical protein [Thermoguttaceae bacterium]
AFSASELSTDAAETTISLAALNDVHYGPYVTPEQAALIALRSNAILADETLAEFNALWDETDETMLAETETDGESLNDVAEALAFESFDLGEIEQEPLPGDASVMSGGSGSSGQSGGGDITVTTSGGTAVASGALAFATDAAISEDDEEIVFYFYGGSALANTTISASVSGVDSGDYSMSETSIQLNDQGFGWFAFQSASDDAYEGDEVATITLSASGTATLSQSAFTVTIVDAPEFISPADATAGNSTVVNEDVFHGEFLDTSNIALNSDVVLFTPAVHSARSVTYTWTVDGIGAGALHLDESTGVVTYNAEGMNEMYGNVTVDLTASYDGASGFSDTISLRLKWGDVSSAKSIIGQWRSEAFQNKGEWITSMNQCESFANYFETYLRERLLIYPNVSCCVNNAAGVTFSVDLQYNPLTTKHAAVRVIYQNGDELFYDNGGFGYVFLLSEIPNYATPDFE